MDYPITPEYMEAAPEGLAELYRGLEEFVLRDICSRLKASGEVTATALEQIKLLQRRGYDLEEIEKYIQKVLGISESEFDKLFEKTIEMNQKYYTDTLTKANLIAEEKMLDFLEQEAYAIALQTKGELKNITQSMGFAIRGADGKVQVLDAAQTYQKILDDAELRILTGASSYNVAMRDAVKQLSDSGLQFVDYSSRKHNRIEVAVRRAIMTATTQISGKYSDMLMEQLDTPYMEITAHLGARDKDGPNKWSNHKKWQGKVYSIRAGDIYPSVYEECGWGEIDGLEGINCRHGHYPWIEGVSKRTYTDEELENIDPPPFEFEGREYTAYEATQKQRQIERALRRTKRELISAEGISDEEGYTDRAARYRALNDEYEAFSKAAGLRPQNERANILEFGPKEAQRALKAVRRAEKAKEDVEKYSAYRYNGDGTIKVTDDWTGRKHFNRPREYKPFAVVDTTSQNGKQRDRTVYDENAIMKIQIHGGDHGRPKKHPYGKHGEHVHDVTWPEGSEKAETIVREATDEERIYYRDILEGEKEK